jgi:hypothetical protein
LFAVLLYSIRRHQVNWDAVGAVAELVGASGVIASLLYLAVQVRASTRASLVDAKLESARLLNDFAEDDWFEVRAVIRFWLHGQGCRAWWAKVGRPMYGDEFVPFIESEISTLDAA